MQYDEGLTYPQIVEKWGHLKPELDANEMAVEAMASYYAHVVVCAVTTANAEVIRDNWPASIPIEWYDYFIDQVRSEQVARIVLLGQV